MERFAALPLFLDAAWKLLINGAVKRNDPLRTAYIGTFDGRNVHLRTMILRKTDSTSRTLLFYSDFRAAKVAHLREFPQLAVLFYHPRKQFQIRLQGAAHLHHLDTIAKRYWEQMPPSSRKNYAADIAPGTPISEYDTGMPRDWQEKAGDDGEAFQNFAAIVLQIAEIECLYLHPGGHQRARFRFNGQDWQGDWLIP